MILGVSITVWYKVFYILVLSRAPTRVWVSAVVGDKLYKVDQAMDGSVQVKLHQRENLQQHNAKSRVITLLRGEGRVLPLCFKPEPSL